MNDHDEARLFSGDEPDDSEYWTERDTHSDLIRRPGRQLKYPAAVRMELKKARREREQQFVDYIRQFDPAFNPNEYTYSSGEHHLYGRIDRNSDD